MTLKRTLSVASATVITLGLSLGQAGARMHRTGNDDATKTLQEIETLAADAEDQADQLVHVSENPNLSPYAHMERLNAMKGDVNRMGRDLAALEAERDTLPKWEQEAVDQTEPLLKEAAKNTENAIEYLNENRTQLWTPDYRSYASNIYDESNQIAKSLKGYLKSEKLREELRADGETGTVGGR
jgi:hypothetical protein